MPNMHSPMCIVYLQFILILSLANYFGAYHLTSLLTLVLCRVCSPLILNNNNNNDNNNNYYKLTFR